MQEEDIQAMLAQNISDALRVLLSDKHLYQSVTIETTFLDEVAAAQHEAAQIAACQPRMGGGGPRHVASLEQFRAQLNTFLRSEWFPSGAQPLVQTGTDILFQNNTKVQKYPLPTIKVTCNHCDERWPFNPIGALVEKGRKSPVDQWISLSYECQNCKGEPIRFLVRRTGTKLTLSGRDPFETIEIPNFIPKQHAKNFRNALIANHAGQTLAGIFLMRVFVEQFWKSIPEVAAVVNDNPRPTGDELGEAYKATLPPAFKERFPTLAEVYGSLSEAMHSASEDAELFAKCHAQIIEHFDARRVFKLFVPSAEN
jgi:hypothetical protein